MLEAYFAGQSANIILPTRGGELVRLGMLSTQVPTRTPEVAATIALEKYLDLIALAFTAVGVAAYMPVEKALWVREWLLPLSGVASVILVLVVLLGPPLWKGLQPKLTNQTPGWLVRAVGLLDRLIQGSLWMRDARRLFPMLLITGLIWLIMWATNLLLSLSFGMRLPMVAGGLVLVFIYLGLLPALMPGNIGPFYFAVQLATKPFGLAGENALAYAMLLHAIVTLPPLLAGGSLLLFSGKSVFRS